MPAPLSSPILRDGDTSFVGLQSRRNPLTIKEGYLQVANNIRLDRGIAQTRKGAARLAQDISSTGIPLTVPFQLQSATISSLSQASNLATATTYTEHGLLSGYLVRIAGATPSAYNGDFVITVTSPTTFTFSVSGSPSSASGTISASYPIVQSSYIGGIFGAGIYSSPRLDAANEYIVLAGNSKAYLWRYGSSIVTKSYPTSPISEQILPGDMVNIVQAFDQLYLFRWRESDIQKPVTSIVQGFTNFGAAASMSYSGTTITATIAFTGLQVGWLIQISGKTGTDAVLNGTWAVTAANTSAFSFVIATAPTAALSNTVIAYATSVATITMPSAHGYSTGEVIRLSGSDQSGFNLDAAITVASTTTFTVTVPRTTAANTSSQLFAQRVCCPLVWDGGSGNFARVTTGSNSLGPTYSNLIAPFNAIASFYNNQMVVASQRDGLIISDVLNAENFDPLLKSFRTNTGSNDYLTAVHPYANGNILCFLRKSIYLGKIVIASDGVSIDKDNSYLQLLTNEVGCSARQTVTTAGTFVYFLSDSGVYRLDNSQIDLALRGNTLPLSEPISDIIATINQSAVDTAQGIYFNNRYYLAVPTGANTSPNTLLVYNQLNESWESSDSLPLSVDKLVISDYGSTRRLFAASSSGLLYLLEEYDNGKDDASTGASTITVSGQITTRRYFYGQLARKRLGNVAVSAYLPSGSSLDVSAVTTDPDNTTQIATVSNSSDDNDYTIRAPIRRPGTYLDLTITTTSGRPTIRAVSADAIIPADTSRLARTQS